MDAPLPLYLFSCGMLVRIASYRTSIYSITLEYGFLSYRIVAFGDHKSWRRVPEHERADVDAAIWYIMKRGI